MKILVCTPEYFPFGSGIANVVYNVVQQFEKMGIECVICSPTGPNIKIKSLQGFGRIGLLHFWYNVGKYFKNKEDVYDVVWLHYPLFIGNIPFKRCLITVYSTAYGFMAENIKPVWYYKLSHVLEKFCLNRFAAEARFTGESHKTCNEMHAILKSDQSIACILNGVDTTLFKPRNTKEQIKKQFGIPLDSKVLLSVGRLVDHKMPFLMLDVFNEVQKRAKSKYTFVIAGKGKLFEPLKEYVVKNHIDNVIFLGYVPDNDLPFLYSCSDYFIITSKYEGGEPVLTLAEAMASGLPSIVSNLSNFQIVNQANSGIMLDFLNYEKAIEEVISYLNTSNYESQSNNARNYVVENHDWEYLANLYFKELNLCVIQRPK